MYPVTGVCNFSHFWTPETFWKRRRQLHKCHKHRFCVCERPSLTHLLQCTYRSKCTAVSALHQIKPFLCFYFLFREQPAGSVLTLNCLAQAARARKAQWQGLWVMPEPWAPQGEHIGLDRCLLAVMDPQHAEESWLRAMPTCCSHTGRSTGTICWCTAGLELAETLSYTITWILDYIIYLIPFWKHIFTHMQFEDWFFFFHIFCIILVLMAMPFLTLVAFKVVQVFFKQARWVSAWMWL